MKHTSFFPYIVLALTLMLVSAFLFFSFSNLLQSGSIDARSSAVSDAHYQSVLTRVLRDFFTSYRTATNDATREQIADQTLGMLLSMRVPSSKKDLHLELAIALQKIKQGFVSNPQDVTDGYAQLQDTVFQTSWIHL